MKNEITITHDQFREQVSEALSFLVRTTKGTVDMKTAMTMGFGASAALAHLETELFKEEEITVEEE